MKLEGIEPRNLDEILKGPLKPRVTSIGLELEGGWKKLPAGVRLTADSSVVLDRIEPSEREKELARQIQGYTDTWSAAYVGPPAIQEEYNKLRLAREKLDWKERGELVSQPMNMIEWKDWIRGSYPSHVNHTCGLHVHMGFKSHMNYQRLMVPEFTKTVVEYMSRWATANLPPTHHIWPRLRGECEYCQHLFFADDQSKTTRKEYEHFAKTHRYTVINYCFLRHSTVECRLLPMLGDVDLAISAIETLLDTTNAFLMLSRKIKEPEVDIAVIATEGELHEHTEVWI